MIANHGQTQLYTHDLVGVNSRLDSIQAAILDIKLTHLNDYAKARQDAADFYTQNLSSIKGIKTPFVIANSTHVYHQYTIQLDSEEKRDALQKHLNDHGIPTKIYYPIPQHLQKAYNLKGYKTGDLPITEHASRTVVSLPMHTELPQEQLDYIVSKVKEFFQ
jgi:dTDP-4-amino-4,6-dideoxygalactose transaminase